MTNKKSAQSHAGTEFRELEKVFAAQQQNSLLISQTSATERIAKLNKILNWITGNRGRIQQALLKDFGKAEAETDLTEIYMVTSEIKFIIRRLNRWMRPRRILPTMTMLLTRSQIRYEAKGVVLIIPTWNFPFNLSISPLVSALAAGNCVILKPSEMAPNTSGLVLEMIGSLFPKNEVAVFEGGRPVGQALLKLPFDHVYFIGSTNVGREIMKAAAEHLSSVTLEMGGKSPTIVDESAKIPDAAKKIAWGKFINSGQACVAPDYLLVHENIFDSFTDALIKQTKKLYGESEEYRRKNLDYARIIDDKHFQRLKKLVESAVKEGAEIRFGAKFNAADRYVEPTILTNVSLNSVVMQEEIFGPVLPVLKFHQIDEALEIVKGLNKPLALYIFAYDNRVIESILSGTSAGGSCINDIAVHYNHLNLPFGGIKESGMGRSHGYHGFKEFSNERAILRNTSHSPFKLLYPPYTRRVKAFIDFLLRYF